MKDLEAVSTMETLTPREYRFVRTLALLLTVLGCLLSLGWLFIVGEFILFREQPALDQLSVVLSGKGPVSASASIVTFVPLCLGLALALKLRGIQKGTQEEDESTDSLENLES